MSVSVNTSLCGITYTVLRTVGRAERGTSTVRLLFDSVIIVISPEITLEVSKMHVRGKQYTNNVMLDGNERKEVNVRLINAFSATEEFSYTL